MNFKENAGVYTSDGKKIGKIDRVVVDPINEQVTHFVMKNGMLFQENKVVPVEHIHTAEHDRILLKQSEINPEDYPDFEKTMYIPVGGVEDFQQAKSREAQRMIWFHNRINIPWWKARPNSNFEKPLFVKETERSLPESAIPLNEGAEVIDAEGEGVGKIEEVYAEPDENRVTHVLLSQGLVFKDKKLIPNLWIKYIYEDLVRLSVKKDVIENLPPAVE